MSDVPAPWMISVSGRAYGPYSHDEMIAFATQGRLVPQSLVAHSGETNFRVAGEDPALSGLFTRARTTDGLGVARLRMQERAPVRAPPDGEDARAGMRAHFVVFADMKSNSIDDLQKEIVKLGPAMAVFPQVWILSTDFSIAAVRNALVQKLGKHDVLFVIDASNDKAAWFNFGPESSARIKNIWAKESDAVGNFRT
jgi:hypothetical protein